MDLNYHHDSNHFDNLFVNSAHDDGFLSFPYNFKDQLLEQQKIFTPNQKKKGRPKGFKTTKPKLEIKNQIKANHKNIGHWLDQQNQRYHRFLEMHSKHFINKHLRRMDKIFKTMADFIETRQAEQCRSHHQKMEKKHQTFYKIIKSLRNQFHQSIDPIHVKMDLQNNRIFEYDPLISEKTLQNQHQPKLQENLSPEEADVHEQLGIDKNVANQNFFVDNYESRFNYSNF